MAAPIRLASFELFEPIGRGGMAEVWRARHAISGAPVAIKVIKPASGDAPDTLASLRNEVQAAASLDHPAIAMVLDFGVTDSQTDPTKRIASRSPWLALELASGGALSSAIRPLPWPQVRHLLLVLLEALAHAHARGVVHRDIKPANVLLCTNNDARPGVKLTDFGMAGRLEDDGSALAGVTGGTPRYMAPEQFSGDTRAAGPWTDLYSVGCLAFDLATGFAPFPGSGWRHLMAAHMGDAPPTLRPAHPHPPGFEGWVGRLLEKHPLDRFRCAADAAHALRALDERDPPDISALPPGFAPPGLEGRGRGVAPARGPVADAETYMSSDDPLQRTTREPSAQTVDERQAGSPLDATPTRFGYAASPPFPDLTERELDVAPAGARVRLLGAGLSLYGVRRPAIVGRAAERDALWRKLRSVHETAGVHVVALVGAAGAGKSRLASWLCEQAHAHGVGTPLRARHAATPGPADGLAAMVSRHLRIVGLSGGAARRRVWSWHTSRGLLERSDPDVALALARPDARAEGGVVLRGATERHRALLRFVACVAEERPVVLWIDDAQWGSDAVAFCQAALMAADAPPMLIVLTARAEALAQDEAVATAFDDIMAHPRTERVEIAPLSARDHHALIRALLPLEPTLVERVRTRTAGNPLFAVELVGEWVRRGLLHAGDDGFVLRAGAETPLPDDLRAVWRGALAAIEERSFRGALRALELAATLGEHVHDAEWTAACRSVAPEASRSIARVLDGLTDELVRAGLAVRTDEGWSFTHGMLRESLVRDAEEAGRWQRHNATVADALLGLWGADASGVSARLGRHRVAAGDMAAALPLLLSGARELMAQLEVANVARVLDAWDVAASALGMPVDDQRRAEVELLRVEAMTFIQGPLATVRRRAAAITRQAERCGWHEITPRALFLEAMVAYRAGTLEKTRALYDRALAAAVRVADEKTRVRALVGLADVDYYLARRDAAALTYKEALELADARADFASTATCLWSLACIEMWRGNLERSERLVRRQLALSEREGDRLLMARGYSTLGECLRLQRRFDEALSPMSLALDILDALGLRVAIVVEMNLLILKIDRGDLEGRREDLRRISGLLLEMGEGTPALMTYAIGMRCAALYDLWTEFDEYAAQEYAALDRLGTIEGDIAENLEAAGRIAADNGDVARARPALLRAVDQWRGCGWTSRAHDVEALLQTLEPVAR